MGKSDLRKKYLELIIDEIHANNIKGSFNMNIKHNLVVLSCFMG